MEMSRSCSRPRIPRPTSIKACNSSWRSRSTTPSTIRLPRSTAASPQPSSATTRASRAIRTTPTTARVVQLVAARRTSCRLIASLERALVRHSAIWATPLIAQYLPLACHATLAAPPADKEAMRRTAVCATRVPLAIHTYGLTKRAVSQRILGAQQAPTSTRSIAAVAAPSTAISVTLP